MWNNFFFINILPILLSIRFKDLCVEKAIGILISFSYSYMRYFENIIIFPMMFSESVIYFYYGFFPAPFYFAFAKIKNHIFIIITVIRFMKYRVNIEWGCWNGGEKAIAIIIELWIQIIMLSPDCQLSGIFKCRQMIFSRGLRGSPNSRIIRVSYMEDLNGTLPKEKMTSCNCLFREKSFKKIFYVPANAIWCNFRRCSKNLSRTYLIIFNGRNVKSKNIVGVLHMQILILQMEIAT